MTSNKCKQCGLVNFAGTAACRRCSTPIVWGAEGGTAEPAFSSQPAVSGSANEFYQQQPFQAAPSLPSYGVPAGGYVSPYASGLKRKSGMAASSLVLGIVGMFTLGIALIGSVTGLVLGIRAVLKANREPSVYGGKGAAIGGIVTNSFAILTIIPAALLAAILIPNFLLAYMSANEASAIRDLRDLGTAEYTYQSTVGRTFTDIDGLVAAGLISPDSANKNGYQFKIRLLDKDGNAAVAGTSEATRYEVVATPDTYGQTGRRSFYTSETFVIRTADKKGKEATGGDPELGEDYREFEPASGSRDRSGRGN